MTSLAQVNPFTIPRGRLERARTPAAGLLQHDFDFSAREFTDRVTGIRVDDPAFFSGDPMRPAAVGGDGVADYIVADVPAGSFLVAPTEPYTVLVECGPHEMSGIHVVVGSGTGLNPDAGWALATLGNKITAFTSNNGSSLTILQDTDDWPANGGIVGIVKDGARLALYRDGQMVRETTSALVGTFATSAIFAFCAAGAGSRFYPGSVRRMRMWSGALDDVLLAPETYAQLGSDG